MSLKDSALAVLQRNHERNKGATSDKKTMQLNAHLQADKVASTELLTAVSDACIGLDMTPEQFIRVLNSKAKEQIISGVISASALKDNAKHIDDAINDGVVESIMERIT